MPWVVFEFKTGFHTPCHLLDSFVLFRSAALLTAVFGMFSIHSIVPKSNIICFQTYRQCDM